MVRSSSGRLDVPGFSFGKKTGEYIDIPRIYGGKGTKRKSGKPHTYQELASRTGIRSVVTATKLAREKYNKGKRFRFKQYKRALTGPIAGFCTRRFLEFSGLRTHNYKYADPPELVISYPRIVYEITNGLWPIVTFTSAREAMLMVKTLARYGIASYFNSRIVPQV